MPTECDKETQVMSVKQTLLSGHAFLAADALTDGGGGGLTMAFSAAGPSLYLDLGLMQIDGAVDVLG
jgi:hypothetical protein